MGVGEWAALSAAMIWTVSSLLWGQIRLSAAILNFAKNGLGCGMLLLHVGLLALVQTDAANWGNLTSTAWLTLSALVGIAIGDTLFFRSLQILGPRLALVMATTAPLFGSAIGWLVFGEWLPWFAWLGVSLTLAGVLLVVTDRRSRAEAPGLFQGSVRAGVLFGLGGALCQALGGGLSKQAMQDCGELEAAAIRTTAAFIATLFYVLLRRELISAVRDALRPENLKYIAPATALGTWLGIWLSQIAFKQAPLAIALTLMATSPLFAIPLVRYTFGHRISPIAIVGSLIAIVGVYLASQATV